MFLVCIKKNVRLPNDLFTAMDAFYMCFLLADLCSNTLYFRGSLSAIPVRRTGHATTQPRQRDPVFGPKNEVWGSSKEVWWSRFEPVEGSNPGPGPPAVWSVGRQIKL